MKLGVFTVLFQKKSFTEMLDYVAEHGLQAIELGTGGYPGKAHCDPAELLGNPDKLKTFKNEITKRNLIISGLSVHGNPLHPNKAKAAEFHADYVQTIKLAQKLEVEVVNLFSGCPGDHEGAKHPNWPVVFWPPEFSEVVKWQWQEKIIPYWKEWGSFAAQHGVKLAFELHGGFSVHSPATLLRLREAVGEVAGANFDPSHLFWQGIDPIQAIRILGKEKAIYHFHAKDTMIDPINRHMYGLLDTQDFGEVSTRAWNFRTVGYGNGEKFWRDVISNLRLTGYDHVISIEHEDVIMSVEEGFQKAVQNLKDIILQEPVGDIWWV